MSSIKDIAKELEARGAVDEARQLERIVATQRAGMSAVVIEAVRLLDTAQTQASKDPKLLNMAARTSFLSNRVQEFYNKGAS